MPDRNAGRRPDPVPEWTEAELEARYRLDTVRVVLDAVAIGDWPLDAQGLAELRRLLDAAARWADLAAALALAA